jgi:TRAP-type mannitol/chloroaromatic compound transport system permease small subunit
MKYILKAIDTVTEWCAKGARWLSAFMIVVIVIEVFMRYVMNAPTKWAYETAMMAGAAMYAFGFAYAERLGSHVRVDVFYHSYSPRQKAISDAILGLLFFLPVIALTLAGSWSWFLKSWRIGEKSVESFWYPPLYPLRTVIFIGWSLLFLQGLAGIYRSFYHWIRGRPHDST